MSVIQNGDGFEGILYKRGRINKSFKERWFIINRLTQMMEYFECLDKANIKSNCLGYIDLALIEKIEVITIKKNYDNDALPEFINYCSSSSEKKSFSFHIISPNRTFILAAISELDLFKWLQYLSICVYGAIIKQGYVKRSEGAISMSKSWKIRYCVLNEYYQLKWYQDEYRNKYLGFIDCNTLSNISNGKVIASELGYILDLYTKYGNVWYVGCKNEMERDEWNKHLTDLMPQKKQKQEKQEKEEEEEKKESVNNNDNIFGDNQIFEEKCNSISKCHSVSRMIQCLHIWNGNGDEKIINNLLSQNKYFQNDYQHILSIHLDERNEFQILYKYVIQHIRHIDLQQNNDLTLPDESQQNTFIINAMYVIHCYFFGNLV